MKLIVDECISRSSISLLRDLGFDIITLDNVLNFGIEDEKIYEYASKYQIPLLTHDRRFGHIFFQSTLNPPLTIILHVISPHPEGTNKLLSQVLNQIDIFKDEYQGKLIIINRKNIRVRSKIN